MNNPTSVQCRIKVIKINNNCPKPDGWFSCLASVSRNKNLPDRISVCGNVNLLPTDLTVNSQFDVELTLKSQSAKHSLQSYDIMLASPVTTTTKGLISYLSQLKGVTRKVATNVVVAYENNTIDMIKNHIDKVKSDCNLSERQAKSLYDGVTNTDIINSIRSVAPELNAKQIKTIITLYGSKTLDIIKTKTYKLHDEAGIPFKTVDTIAMRFNGNPFDLTRLNYGIKYCIQRITSDKNDLYINLSKDDEYKNLLYNVEILLNISFNKVSANPGIYFGAILTSMNISNKPIIHIDDYNNEKHLYLYDTWTDMMQVVSHIRSSKSKASSYCTAVIDVKHTINSCVRKWEQNNNMSLTKEQKDAVTASLQHKLSVITGGPGRGKTKVIDCIASCWYNSNVKLLAPTGKAMNKLKIETKGCYNTMTIDNLLCRLQNENISSRKSNNNLSSSLTSDALIIIDESSMISLSKLALMFQYLNKCQIVFVGDVDQLPPIDPGYVLKDIIESNSICVSKLTIPLRNSGYILSNADKINNNDTNLQYDFNSMPFYPQANDDDVALDFVIKQYNDERINCPDITKIALLSPMRKGPLGTVSLNLTLQNTVCPRISGAMTSKHKATDLLMYTMKGHEIDAGPLYGDSNNYTKFRIGDIVMNTKNIYNIETIYYKNNDYFNGDIIGNEYGIFNGDCGRIIAFIPQQIDNNCYDDDDDIFPNSIVVQMFDNRFVILNLSNNEFDSFDLGYAMTVHKSQGCEYDTVVTISPQRLLTLPKPEFACKNLIYTAVTRAKERVVIIGSKDALNKCILTNIPPKNSNLAQRL